MATMRVPRDTDSLEQRAGFHNSCDEAQRAELPPEAEADTQLQWARPGRATHMTHAPHLATLEEVMNGHNQFELINTRLGTMERWRANAMLIGETGGIQSVYDAIRSDSAALAARAGCN
jgi:hypothetical protein